MDRMNRAQFYAATAGLGEDRLRTVLWTVYWRSAAPVRQRIEAELAPADAGPRPRAAAEGVDPEAVLEEVQQFVALARAGSYLAGDRRVSPKERTRWRFTFRRLMADARHALAADDPEPGAAAMETMIDLACELRDYDYFRSDDPVEAAGIVISDEVGRLWARLLDRFGFPVFADRAAGQFVRWESRFGWTRRGWGRVSEKEDSLTTVVAGLLPVPDAWVTFAGCYLAALEQAAAAPAASRASWRSAERDGARRAEVLAEWHLLLLDRFAGTDDEGILDRLAGSAGLGGPELLCFQARLAHGRGDVEQARTLVERALATLPGHEGFFRFAAQIGATLPPRARQIARDRGLPTASTVPTPAG